MAHSTGRHLGRITTPTVVVAGSDDIVMPPRSARLLAERIPNAVLEIVPDCGHGISFSHPDVVRRAVARLSAPGNENANENANENENETRSDAVARSA
jgi:pimeloyl-ACP methyl ester carboxylesterase